MCFSSSTTLLAFRTNARLPRCCSSAGVCSMALIAFPSSFTAASSSLRSDSYRRLASSRSVSASEIRSCCSSSLACCVSIAASMSASSWRAPSRRFWMRPTAAVRVSALRMFVFVLATHSSLSLTSCSSFCFKTFSMSSIFSCTSWKDTPDCTIARTVLASWERGACARKASSADAREFCDDMDTCTKFDVAAVRTSRASGLSSTLIASYTPSNSACRSFTCSVWSLAFSLQDSTVSAKNFSSAAICSSVSSRLSIVLAAVLRAPATSSSYSRASFRAWSISLPFASISSLYNRTFSASTFWLAARFPSKVSFMSATIPLACFTANGADDSKVWRAATGGLRDVAFSFEAMANNLAFAAGESSSPPALVTWSIASASFSSSFRKASRSASRAFVAVCWSSTAWAREAWTVASFPARVAARPLLSRTFSARVSTSSLASSMAFALAALVFSHQQAYLS
mmetsp:Transcript_50181/g.132289  ORF Transcript_50181/g.132289 Transcript_50181/m.132289 type:complete len:457 (-) Transcript_50181:38-1408(-)